MKKNLLISQSRPKNRFNQASLRSNQESKRGIELQAYSGNILRWYGTLEVDAPQDREAVQTERGITRAEP